MALVHPSRAPTVIVLASGRGERFVASGGQGSKLQAALAGRPVLEWTLDAVRASGLPFHVEAAGHAGMGDSIAAAVRATRDANGWLVLPGDLPLVRPETLQAVAQALAEPSFDGAEVVVPVHGGQRGHPVGFKRACGDALAGLSGPQGAVSVVKARRVRELPVEDDGVGVDIDTVEALAGAERILHARSGGAPGPAVAAPPAALAPLPPTPLGRYRHYKGLDYEVLGVARHSETKEPLVVYRPLYDDSGLWVRPHAMFFGQVEVDGRRQPRFALVDPATGHGPGPLTIPHEPAPPMKKSRSAFVPLLAIAGVLALALVLNPSPERHHQKIKEVIAQRNTLARMLSLGSLAALVSNYHSLGVASYTKVGDRILSVGFMGYVHVPSGGGEAPR